MNDRFETELPNLLAELAPRAKPDYRDDIVRQTARTRQRPAWMVPERWIPMSVTTTRVFAAPPIPWRVAGIVALLVLALVVGLALVAGSQRRLPAPFGPAGNGVVAYEGGGDILIADPETGAAKAIVTGSGQDLRPVFSGDGTHVVFERSEGGNLGRLMVSRSDGTGLVAVTPGPISGLDTFATAPAQYTFSPDGKEIAIWSTPDTGGKLWIAQSDGTGVRQLDVPMTVIAASYLPPNGDELIVTASTNGGANGIYAIDRKTGAQLTMIVAPDPASGLDYVRLSPDGSRLAYVSPVAKFDAPASYRVHVVDLDRSNNITLPMPAKAVFQDAPAWSNDGTRLAITRGYARQNEDMAVAVVPPDGASVGIESTHGLTGCCDTLLQWSPDDTSILIMPEDLDSQAKQLLLLDPSTATFAPAPWTAKAPPAWQRTVR